MGANKMRNADWFYGDPPLLFKSLWVKHRDVMKRKRIAVVRIGALREPQERLIVPNNRPCISRILHAVRYGTPRVKPPRCCQRLGGKEKAERSTPFGFRDRREKPPATLMIDGGRVDGLKVRQYCFEFPFKGKSDGTV